MEKEKPSLKKRIVKTIIGVIALGIVGTSAYSAYKIDRDNNFKRVVSEEGEYDLENMISYNNLKVYNIVEVNTILGDNKLFIAKPDIGVDQNGIYLDIFTGKNIAGEEGTEVLAATPLEDYLIACDMVKAKYSKEDIEKLLKLIKDNYKYNEEKVLVKEQETI